MASLATLLITLQHQKALKNFYPASFLNLHQFLIAHHVSRKRLEPIPKQATILCECGSSTHEIIKKASVCVPRYVAHTPLLLFGNLIQSGSESASIQALKFRVRISSTFYKRVKARCAPRQFFFQEKFSHQRALRKFVVYRDSSLNILIMWNTFSKGKFVRPSNAA